MLYSIALTKEPDKIIQAEYDNKNRKFIHNGEPIPFNGVKNIVEHHSTGRTVVSNV